MKTLYLDTSSSFLYTAIIEDNEILIEIKERLDKDLSVKTLSKVSGMFEIKNISPNEINKIIVVNGPGSFTGIRIGLTIAKTFAWAKKVPIIAISSIEAMALSYDEEEANYVVPIIDARRNFVFSAIYSKENSNFVMKEQYINLNTLEAAIDNLPGKFIYITNDQISLNNKYVNYEPNILKIVMAVQNREPVNPHSIDANYLKLTEAEEKNDTRA